MRERLSYLTYIQYAKKFHNWIIFPKIFYIFFLFLPGGLTPAKSSMDGRLRSAFGCPSVRKLPYVYEELETPSTLCTPTSSSFVSPCGLGDNSERCSSLPERKAHEGEHKFTESCRHQHSASKRNRQRHLCMQDILCRLESNKSHFRSYAPAVVPSPLRASVLICPGFSFFCTYFFLLIAA